MNNYEEVKEVVNTLIKDTNIPDSQQNTVAEYITEELIRKIDFYTRKFYMIVTKDGRFIRYSTTSSGSKEVFIGMSPSSATVFNDIVSCNEVLSKCKSKYPSEVFFPESFAY